MKTPKTTCSKCNGSGQTIDHLATGLFMRAARLQSHNSLRCVATSMGFSPAYLSDLELGRRCWSFKLIKAYNEAIKG